MLATVQTLPHTTPESSQRCHAAGSLFLSPWSDIKNLKP